MTPEVPPKTPQTDLTLSAGGERRRQFDKEPTERLSVYRDCAGFDRTPWTEAEKRLAWGDR